MADYLEQIKRMAQGQGFTEGGILKALADAANELKRSDYQFERRMGLEERQIKNQEDAATQAQEQQYIIRWITGLSGLGAFGTPGASDVTTLKYDAEGKPIGKETVQGQLGTPNWLQKIGAYDWGKLLGGEPSARPGNYGIPGRGYGEFSDNNPSMPNPTDWSWLLNLLSNFRGK